MSRESDDYDSGGGEGDVDVTEEVELDGELSPTTQDVETGNKDQDTESTATDNTGGDTVATGGGPSSPEHRRRHSRSTPPMGPVQQSIRSPPASAASLSANDPPPMTIAVPVASASGSVDGKHSAQQPTRLLLGTPSAAAAAAADATASVPTPIPAPVPQSVTVPMRSIPQSAAASAAASHDRLFSSPLQDLLSTGPLGVMSAAEYTVSLDDEARLKQWSELHGSALYSQFGRYKTSPLFSIPTNRAQRLPASFSSPPGEQTIYAYLSPKFQTAVYEAYRIWCNIVPAFPLYDLVIRPPSHSLKVSQLFAQLVRACVGKIRGTKSWYTDAYQIIVTLKESCAKCGSFQAHHKLMKSRESASAAAAMMTL